MKIQDVQDQEREREIVDAASGGDLAAFRTLYERYRDKVFALAFYWLGDRGSAEDVVQLVFLNVYKSLAGFRFESSFVTWLRRITINGCSNYKRRRAGNFVPLEDILGSDFEYAATPPPDAQSAQRERQEIIGQAILELPPKLRAVVALKYLESLSYEEIASVLGCSEGTVASRLNRALTRLESRLRPFKRLL
jgi:RNA polymerase sigma-70 factor (ECF subfamily)